MKSVLISIQPKWCELIASGKKTIEVRKTAPKLETPFKCYIYCTQGKGLTDTLLTSDRCHVLNGKVIGEFVCDRIDIIENEQLPITDTAYEDRKAYYGSLAYTGLTCISYEELSNYVGFGITKCYGWHISSLKIYDKPKELGEFTYPCAKGKKDFNADANCKGCRYAFKGVTSEEIYCDRTVVTAPQSWCYVEA